MDSNESLVQSLIAEGYLKTPKIIEAFRAIDRADFVRPEYKNEAYENYPLPIGEGQTISQPLTVAFMLELLEPGPGQVILDVGSGSAWTTALLAHIASGNRELGVRNKGRVMGIERIPSLCEFGKENVIKYNFSNAEIVCGDGTIDLSQYGPFDRILAGAAASASIPEEWRKELKVGGRVVAPVGGSVWLFTKKSKTEWDEREFRGFSFVPLL